MIVPKKTLFVFGILSMFIFSGCTGPKLDQQELNVPDTTQSDTTTKSQGYKIDGMNIQADETAQQDTTNTKGSMNSGMKQLSDFEKIEAKTVTLKTTKGDITFEIYTDAVPVTAQNFLNLAKSGFYDGIVFHRVIDDFMAQVGDPLTKEPGMEARWGTGGPGYAIPDEFVPTLKHDSAGVVSMANSGPNSGGSQFFITFEATPWLDGKHAVFGKVTTGLDVLKTIKQGDKITAVTYQ